MVLLHPHGPVGRGHRAQPEAEARIAGGVLERCRAERLDRVDSAHGRAVPADQLEIEADVAPRPDAVADVALGDGVLRNVPASVVAPERHDRHPLRDRDAGYAPLEHATVNGAPDLGRTELADGTDPRGRHRWHSG